MAAVQPQQVRKIFVVGLGSTGTEVCDLLAKRLEDEFGSLDQVPWVQFQCFETDAAKSGLMSQRGKLMPLTISKNEYQAMLADPTSLESVLHFSRYWDTETLRHIDDVSAGVGNIRMAGRLAFFHPSNFAVIEQNLPTAVSRLVNLSALEAAEKRGPLQGGHEPPIQFQADNNMGGINGNKSVVIIVVGTLCGGTASGLCVDMGYYLGDKCGSDAHVISLFTLPHPKLPSPVKSTAERLKANSYAALRELHHFSQIGDIEYVAKYPTQDKEIRKRGKPYEIALLSWPRAATKESPKELHAALAERLFLLSFSSSDTDPFATGVDVDTQYRDGGAKEGSITHTMFGTLGVGTLEHPGPRILDYCAYRLQEYTLATWARREITDPQINSALAKMGVFWDQIYNDALRHAGGEGADLREQLKKKADAALETLKREPSGWAKELDQLGLAFGDALGSSPDPGLPANVIPKNLSAAQPQITDDLAGRVEAWVERSLMHWDTGPDVCRQVVDAALTRLSEIQTSLTPATGSTETILRGTPDQLHALRGSWTVSILGLYNRAASDVVDATRPQLNLYIEQRLRDSVASILVSRRSAQGIASDGVLDSAAKRLKVLRRRLARLTGSAGAYAAFCGRQKSILEIPPNLSGEMLMRSGQADLEYREELAPQSDDQAFAAAQERAASNLLVFWNELASSMIAATPVFYDDALASGDPEVIGETALPEKTAQLLLNKARTQFTAILADDVLKRWAAEQNPNDLVGKLKKAAEPFIPFDTAKVLRLLGKPADQNHLASYPNAGTAQPAAVRFGNLFGNDITKKPSNSKYRATVMNEFYGLPLEALSGIVKVNGGGESLEDAVFHGWTLESRNNPGGWLPISPDERARLARLRQILAISIVLGHITVRAQALVIENYPAQGFGGVLERKLPNSLEEAVRQWALNNKDTQGLGLESLENHLVVRIAGVRSPSNQGAAGFLKLLEQRLPTAGAGLREWNKADVDVLIDDYCMNDTELQNILRGNFGPGDDMLKVLQYRVGETTVAKISAAGEGYYCINIDKVCNGFLGATEDAAAAQNWCCPVCSIHYSHASSTYLPDWIPRATNIKHQPRTQNYPASTVTSGNAAPSTINPFASD